ncbi:Ger(x)C family spore germination protein [Bacillus sp. FDAARGOS_1420]|uniref:Ger(x)C family spore germination protein n=1 Tax=unclassified Bacillus (in: firmicutes) TaxID=185979 RepID=UPI001C5A7A73|nr:Ger(x)C family spore germination protein [Bacillus sp. FDAARGOS_1420]MBW3496509.1 Ger(x)C family spore germination protein [Bacillus sp. FDAARGOS_1420]
MKSLKSVLIYGVFLMLLTGCWDQKLLKDAKLVMGVGYDLTTDEKLLETVILPLFSASESGMQSKKSQIISEIGNTAHETRDKINNAVSKRFDPAQLKIVLFGEKYAKMDIYPALDVFYRDQKSSLLSNVAVVEGTAHKMLQIKTNEPKTMDSYLMDLIVNAQEATIIAKPNKPLISHIYNPGVDLVLPLLKTQQNKVKIQGLAMFNGEHYTGHHLTRQESTLYLLMANQKAERAVITLKIHQNKHPEMKNYITINVIKSKRHFKINTSDLNNLAINPLLDLKIEIVEDPEKHVYDMKRIKKLNQEISRQLTQQIRGVLQKTQEANSDILGIGKYIIAYHNETWKHINWKQVYPNLKFKPEVKVEILKHGVFN